MKTKTIAVKALAVLIVIAGVAALNSCTTSTGKVSVRQSEIDSLRNEIKVMTSGNAELARNLATFDTLDYTVFSNAQWVRLHESHSKDVKVNWPDGHFTVRIEKHIQDLASMFVYAPDTRIKQHPVRFGSSTGEWTAVTGIM